MTDDHKTLKLTKPYMHGPAVVRLQEMLYGLGFNFDNAKYSSYESKIDGIFGEETEACVFGFQVRHGLVRDGICGPKTWDALIKSLNGCGGPGNTCEVKDMSNDRRGLHPNPRLYKCKRPWSQIDGVTLHQTGCEMPSNPAGWDRVNAHIGITQEGLCILINDPRDFIWHAQGLSPNTIGIEIEGNYCGIDGDESTLWRGGGGPHHLNPKMMTAVEQARLWIAQQFEANGQKWKHIYAHRQSARSRIGDPGEEIWRDVAIPWMRKMEIKTDSSFYLGTGRPLPKEWWGFYAHNYNCAPGSE